MCNKSEKIKEMCAEFEKMNLSQKMHFQHTMLIALLGMTYRTHAEALTQLEKLGVDDSPLDRRPGAKDPRMDCAAAVVYAKFINNAVLNVLEKSSPEIYAQFERIK